MKSFSFLCLFFLLIGIVKGQNSKQIVLNDKASLKYELGNDYKRISLNDEDIRLADSLAAKYMLENHSQYSWTRRVENYYDYYRQYAGYSTLSHNKIIFINAFRSKPETITNESLQETVLSARGGGSSFFTIKIDLQAMTCFDLRVNAPK